MEITHTYTLLSLVLVGLGVSSSMGDLVNGFILEYGQILYELRWMIILGILLVISDFWFGVSESRMKRKKVRRSSACRKSINKSIDYFCYITLGSIFGKAMGEYYHFDPIFVSASVMIICYLFEIDSVYGHICALHGIKKPLSIWKVIRWVFTLKFKDLGNAIKEMDNQAKTHKQQKKNKQS